PRILADLLKDPTVTASLIRNIGMLQEVLQLIPGTNAALTQEIEQLFEALLMQPDEIVPELLRQEENTTLFRGELFDQLRQMLAENPNNSEMATGIGVFLKSLNAAMGRRDVLDSVANNLSFLADRLSASQTLSERLDALIGALRQPDAPEKFQALKAEIFTLLKDIQGSVLYTPQMEKTLPLVVYNLSRYNDNDDFMPDALRLLLSTMDGDAAKEALVDKLQTFLARILPQQPNAAEQVGALLSDGARAARAAEDDSQVMEVLAKIIGRQAKSEDIQLLSGDKLEKIIHSLLSSPSNFTPLLHYIVPVEYMDLQAFAEIWIDPNAPPPDEGKKNAEAGGATHMLLVFDVDGIGRFETELYVVGKRIALNLLCPPAYTEAFKGIGAAIRQAVASTGYSFESINIDRLERTHSLMEVFRDLPHKRMGIDVKI
ncbi:MAG: antitoxin, partial [Oscillospiraceae bacterium]